MKKIFILIILFFSAVLLFISAVSRADIFTRGKMIYDSSIKNDRDEGSKRDDPAEEGTALADAGSGHVLSGFEYWDKDGSRHVGTYVPLRSTDVRSGVRFGADSGETGTYTGTAFFNLPRTGQIRTFYPRDDGNLRKGITSGYTNSDGSWDSNTRFTDNNDGTITDNLTGLMWIKDPSIFGQMSWTKAISNSANCLTGGYTDWRLPNRFELESLLDLNECFPVLSLGHPFENVTGLYYWTSTVSMDTTSDAWYVDIQHGRTSHTSKSSGEYIWYCRDK